MDLFSLNDRQFYTDPPALYFRFFSICYKLTVGLMILFVLWKLIQVWKLDFCTPLNIYSESKTRGILYQFVASSSMKHAAVWHTQLIWVSSLEDLNELWFELDKSGLHVENQEITEILLVYHFWRTFRRLNPERAVILSL